ncbi:Polycomb group protein EMBRYONIC FLOWER 2 [Glycine soja]|uniref:Polycomb group protein EMBRYONIC FLOWER 2 n=1 Tax=Glycine soja TaxID=3848 RepID=A0A445IL98_GLYSO|nr:Polycomb group protein EMBRYONIC FLOWER 2 [Glycine soja]
MDKSLKVGEDEWRERERGEQNFEREKRENERERDRQRERATLLDFNHFENIEFSISCLPFSGSILRSHPDACEHLSAEEELAAEESLSIYCKPVELYNILQRRAMRNPSFLQRCLHYRIKAKHKKRIQMAVSLTRTITESQNVFPMSICLARRISDHGASRQTAIYQIGRIFIFRNSPGIDLNTQVQANFTLPEVNKLAEEARSCSLDILFVSTATVENSNLSSGVNSNSKPSDLNHLAFFECEMCFSC